MALFPPYFANFPWNTPSIPASNWLRLAKRSLTVGHISNFQTAPRISNIMAPMCCKIFLRIFNHLYYILSCVSVSINSLIERVEMCLSCVFTIEYICPVCEANKKTAFHIRAFFSCHLCLSVERNRSWMALFLDIRQEYRQKKRSTVCAHSALFRRIIKRI